MLEGEVMPGVGTTDEGGAVFGDVTEPCVDGTVPRGDMLGTAGITKGAGPAPAVPGTISTPGVRPPGVAEFPGALITPAVLDTPVVPDALADGDTITAPLEGEVCEMLD